MFPESRDVTIEKQIAEFDIDMTSISPVGIIVNELLTNVFKHAFKGRTNGKVSVSIDKKDQEVTLIIQDNGRGFDARALENTSSGLGFTIVKMLVEQLGGTYRLANDNGAKSVVRFGIQANGILTA